jgi:hypothetical protein
MAALGPSPAALMTSGGASRSRGNRNAQKNGLHTGEAIAERRQVGELVRQSRKLILEIE